MARRTAPVAAWLALASPAQAQPSLLIPPALLQSAVYLLGSSSLCVTYTYDRNGNRITQVTAGVPAATPQWGTDKFGCFVWH